MNPYATSDELAVFSGKPVTADAERLLARASDLIDATVFGSFAIDSATDLPVDPLVAAAMRDAACAQVEFWGEVGEGNDVDGLAGSDYSMAGYSGKRPPRVAPRTLDYLRAGGLLSPYGGLGLTTDLTEIPG